MDMSWTSLYVEASNERNAESSGGLNLRLATNRHENRTDAQTKQDDRGRFGNNRHTADIVRPSGTEHEENVLDVGSAPRVIRDHEVDFRGIVILAHHQRKLILERVGPDAAPGAGESVVGVSQSSKRSAEARRSQAELILLAANIQKPRIRGGRVLPTFSASQGAVPKVGT